ncbi:hypothetical protein AVEN_33152-1 [Araneus ventricosus]|uniref:Uncharacterized protein n=1 Tax=Araneus ventricosus TaxID=182803 RepID=A0A4Y2LG69_ARAVE|nr:hypothetical protein AVEN_33152-1 [Araneus ventricosus]
MNANEEGQGGEVTVDSLGRSAVFSQQAVRFLLSRVRREMAVIVQKFRLRILMTFHTFQKFRLRILMTFQTSLRPKKIYLGITTSNRMSSKRMELDHGSQPVAGRSGGKWLPGHDMIFRSPPSSSVV